MSCPFYGHFEFHDLLIQIGGNRCAKWIHAHAPCYMEVHDGMAPDWKTCKYFNEEYLKSIKMTRVVIFNNGDACWPDLDEKRAAGLLLDEMDTNAKISFALLEKGTQQGKPTVTIRVDMADGRVLLTQTTLRLFQSTADALSSAHEGNMERQDNGA